MELQKQLHDLVAETKSRSGWPVWRTLKSLGVSRTTYYRWLREKRWAVSSLNERPRPVQAFEALPEEKQAVKDYALKHPEIRHRELSWRMLDEDVAALSSSTVYRILREENLMKRHRGRTKRYREEVEKAKRANERWATDLMHIQLGERTYYFVAFLDEYSRYIVHWELLTGMDGISVSTSAQAALETLPKGEDGRPREKPEIRSDRGSAYISREFREVLDWHGLTHAKIKPHCPEENGLMERANRTFREALEEYELASYYEVLDALGRIIRWYNDERLHSSLGWLRPADYYRGNPDRLHQGRRLKLQQARHRRKQINLGIRQRTLPLETAEAVHSN